MSERSWPWERTRICVSLAAPDPDSLRAALRRAGDAHLVEVRLDALERAGELTEEELRELAGAGPVPVGFTCRPVWEGGGFHGEEPERRRLLHRAAAAGAAFVDVEHQASWAAELVEASPVPVVLSHHWEDPRPADLEARAREMAGSRPALVKLVAPAVTPDDALQLLREGRRLVEAGQPATAFCMGEAGRASRVLAASYGAGLTYAALPGDEPVAPGQWTVDELQETLRLSHWRAGTVACGLVGDPIGHSLSPAIFNAAFGAADRDLGYVPIVSPELGPALELAEGWGFRGLSVTMPFKAEAARRCRGLEPLAEAIGAVNTLVASPEGWLGHNTDAAAVIEALGGRLELEGARVALLGAGGAARAAAVALARAGAGVTVLNRTVERAEALAAEVGGRHGPVEVLREGLSRGFDAVVHATPVGMAGTGTEGETPFPCEWLRGDEVVFDMVYRPLATPLLREAERRGCRTVDGLEMFLAQAAAQYRLWTGETEEVPLATMRETARAALGQDLD